MRVLIVDDEAVVRHVLAKLCQRLGHVVVEAGDAVEALAAEGPFDVALIDLTLVGMPGIALVARLHLGDPSLRAVAMSGNAEVPAMLDPTAWGFASALSKPFNTEALAVALGGPS